MEESNSQQKLSNWRTFGQSHWKYRQMLSVLTDVMGGGCRCAHNNAGCIQVAFWLLGPPAWGARLT